MRACAFGNSVGKYNDAAILHYVYITVCLRYHLSPNSTKDNILSTAVLPRLPQ